MSVFQVNQPSAPTNSSTLIEFLLDETGSMDSCRDATISGFNEFVHGQKTSNSGSCLLTLTKFDSRGVNTVYSAKAINLVENLDRNTYTPTASTNLYDTIGVRIKDVEARIGGLAEKPDVLMVIMTDGQDNCSREYTADSVKTMIKEKEALGWSFVFLGANQDAWQVGQTFGMSKGNTMTYDTNNVVGAMATLSASTESYRSLRSAGAVAKGTASQDFFGGGDASK